jgi:hypothetical protein
MEKTTGSRGGKHQHMNYHPIPWYMKQAQGGEGT